MRSGDPCYIDGCHGVMKTYRNVRLQLGDGRTCKRYLRCNACGCHAVEVTRTAPRRQSLPYQGNKSVQVN